MTSPLTGDDGYRDVLGPNNAAINNIANAIANLIQPYKRQEIGLRRAISADPSLAQKLADLAALNPDAMRALAGPNAAKYFGGLDPSPETKARIATRPAVDAAINDPDTQRYIASQQATGLASGTPGNVQQDKLRGKLATEGVKTLDTNEDASTSAGLRAATGQSAGKFAQDQQLARRQNDITGALDVPDMRNEWVKAVTGQPSKLTFRQVSALMDDPVQRSLLIPYIEQMRTQRFLAGMKAMDMRASLSQGDALDKMWLTKAIDVMTKTGKGTTAAILKIIGAPDRIVANAGEYTDQQLQEAVDAFSLISQQNEGKGSAGATKANQTILAGWDNYPDQVRASMVQLMNNNALSGNLPYYYTTDSDGKVVTVDMTSGKIIDGSTQVGGRAPTNSPETKLPPKPTKESSGGGGKASVRVKTSEPATSTDNAFDLTFSEPVREMRKIAKGHTADEVKKSARFQALTPAEQAYILSNTTKK